MRILYGVAGDGMGNAIRSKVVITHLASRGHDLKIVVTGRAYAYLSKAFPEVVEIKGVAAADTEGAMKTVAEFRPQAVITDFDTFAYHAARHHKVSILSIGNQQMIARCKHEDAIKQEAKADYQLTKALVREKLPSCDGYVITSFFFPPIKKKYEETTTLVPPILRREIIDARSRAEAARSDQVVVLRTKTSDPRLIQKLNQISGARFVVYGFGKDERHGNCTLKSFSEDGFVDDLAHARAVVTNGGLSLMGEAIYLRKPIFCLPVRESFEQLMNARYLDQLGYGVNAETLEPEALKAFLANSAKYAARLTRHVQDGNKLLYSAIDRWLRTL